MFNFERDDENAHGKLLTDYPSFFKKKFAHYSEKKRDRGTLLNALLENGL